MAKIKSVYICSECGYESPKWYGKCPSCGEWNTMNEEIKDTAKPSPAARTHTTAYAPPVHIREISMRDGFSTSLRPASVISNTPISLVEP